MAQRTFRIGTRASQLALAQANTTARQLREAIPDCAVEIVEITSSGDSDQSSALASMGGVGVFTKRLEDELLAGGVDIVVHSAKDLPSVMTDGLNIGAVPRREAIQDVLVSREGLPFEQLPDGCRIGTGSPRRRAQLLHLRPDLKMAEIRGNVDTRLRKLRDGDYDAIILAYAGLIRLGLRENATEVFASDVLLPAPGQGALIIQVRENDVEAAKFCRVLDHPTSHRMLVIERLLLAKLQAGCATPLGGLATPNGDSISLKAALLDNEGTKRLYAERSIESEEDDDTLVSAVVDSLMSQGARGLLE